MNPKQQARQTIDAMLTAAGWAVQDYKAFDSSASIGVALRGIEADFGPRQADNFHRDLRADYVLANPHFNDTDTALRGSTFLRSEAEPQVLSEAKDNFRKDDYSTQNPVCLWFLAKNIAKRSKPGRHHPQEWLNFIKTRRARLDV